MTHSPSMNDELNNRLDELFEDGTALDDAKKKGEPLEGLKAVILEMEWEIDENTLGKYLKEVNTLKGLFSGDKALSVYIKLLETLGKYLMARKAQAHPDSIRFLKTLHEDFQRVNEEGISQAERNRSAMVQANAFRQLKAQISPAAPAPKAAAGEGVSDELKAYIRQVVREEIARLVKSK